MGILARLSGRNAVKVEHWGRETPLAAMTGDASHLAVTGWSGSGLTTLLAHVVRAAQREGRPVAMVGREDLFSHEGLEGLGPFTPAGGGIIVQPFLTDRESVEQFKASVTGTLEDFARRPGAVIVFDVLSFHVSDIVEMASRGALVVTSHHDAPRLLMRRSMEVVLRCDPWDAPVRVLGLPSRLESCGLDPGIGFVRRPGTEWQGISFDRLD